MKKMSLAALQAAVHEQASKRKYWDPKDMLLQLGSEVGELDDAELKLSGTKPLKPGKEPPDIELELGDILYALCCYANVKGIDLSKALLKKISINEKRDRERFETPENKQSTYGGGQDGNPHGDE